MKERLLFIMAHPDDSEIWTGGTIINHYKKKDKICVYYLSCDEEIRKKEAKKTADKLDIELFFTQKEIDLKIISDFNPSIIITHWQHDSHPEHVLVYEKVFSIIPKLVLDYKLRFTAFSCDCYNSLGNNLLNPFSPTDYIDITDVWEEKLELIRNYDSQPNDYWIKMVTNQNKMHGARCGVPYAEGFIQISILGVVKRSNYLLRG